MTNAQHLSTSAEWATPGWLIEASREVLGEIDLDPATTAEINARHVRAKSYLTAEHDALTCGWHGRVFLNPPGSCRLARDFGDDGVELSRIRKVCGTQWIRGLDGDDDDKPKTPPGSCKLVSRFWKHLSSQHVSGRVPAAIWMGFSLEQLSALQRFDLSPMDYPLCVIGPSRVRYLDAANDLQPAGSPTHASFVTYLGPQPSTFRAVFSKFGRCK